MANTVWHHSNLTLGVILALLAAPTMFALMSLEGPLRIGLAAVCILGIVLVTGRIGQNQRVTRTKSS